ncbi:hypothetical protein D3C76_950520 [compost metagenome]
MHARDAYSRVAVTLAEVGAGAECPPLARDHQSTTVVIGDTLQMRIQLIEQGVIDCIEHMRTIQGQYGAVALAMMFNQVHDFTPATQLIGSCLYAGD